MIAVAAIVISVVSMLIPWAVEFAINRKIAKEKQHG